ncbi:MAG: helix-turn-helix transcriptional regulator [Hyphomonadaceae bacterium]
MSGVVKDDTPPNSGEISPEATGVDEKIPGAEGVLDVEASESGDDTASSVSSRRPPHLRVVGEDDSEFEPAPVEPQIPAIRMGAALRKAREDRGLTLEAVSKVIRVTVSDLQAIEDMTPNLIRGATVHIKGHVKSYARHLGLNADEVLAQYMADCPILADPVNPEPVTPQKPAKTGSGMGMLPILGGVALLAAAGAAAFVFMSSGKNDDAPVAAATAPAAAPVAAAPTATASAPPLTIVALRRAKIVVRGADGTKFVSRYMAEGESYAPRVGAGWTVSAEEDGSAFEWRLGDMSLGLLSDDAAPVYAQSVDTAIKRTPVGPAAELAGPEGVPATTETNEADPAEAAYRAPANRSAASSGSSERASAPVRTQPQSAQPQASQSAPTPARRPARPAASPAETNATPAQPAAPPPVDPALAAYQ